MEIVAAPASGLRRFGAGAVDALVALALALLLSESIGRWFAGRAVDALRIGRPDSLWTGGAPMVLGAAGDLVYGMPLALTLILSAEPLTLATPGKQVLGIRIVPADSRRRLFVRFLVKGLGAWAVTLSLAAGSWPATALAAGLGALGLVGCLPALFGRPALHDHASSMRVVRPIAGRSR